MNPAVEQPPSAVPAVLPAEVVRTTSGGPAIVVARTGRGWTVLGADPVTDWTGTADEGEALTLVEAMSLADLVAAEHGITLEPTRDARRAARTRATEDGAPAADGPAPDPRDAELEALRRTVGQLEHALAARVSIERAIGVLAERHGSTPREAFDELRRRARSSGRPASELAAEVLEGLATRAAVPGQRTAPGPAVPPTAGPRPAPGPASGHTATRRVQRSPRSTEGDTVPEARS